MSNQILVTKITLQNMTNAVVEWVYGTDSVSASCSSDINLASLSLADRQSPTKVAELLETEISSTVFADLDANLTSNASPPPI